jgi:prevent-host-death family protein
MGVTNARQNFTELVSEADEHKEPMYVTHFGEPRAVIIGYEAFEELQQRLEDLEDMVAIYQAREEPRRPLDEVWAEIEAESELHGIPDPAG